MSRQALVTGASSGIGHAFARALAAQGYRVCAVARREDRLGELLAQLPGDGHQAVVADLSRREGVESVAARLREGRWHLLVNNAGSSVFEPFYTSDIERQRDTLALNCGAAVDLAHAFLGQAAAGDALVNLGSIVSFLPTPAQPLYSASKAFMASFSECLWEEQRHRGVYVMGLCPGITRTEFIAGASGGSADGQNLPASLLQTPEEVVEEALRALSRRRRAIVVTGRANRLMLQMPRVLSRQRLLRVLAYLGDPDRAL